MDATFVLMEASKFVHRLLQETQDDPPNLAAKLYVILQIMKSSGKENSVPYQIISRARETVIEEINLDIDTLVSPRLPLAAGSQIGDFASSQLAGGLAIEVPVFPGGDELISSEINSQPYCVGEHQDSGHQQRPVIVVDDTDSVTSTSQAEHLISSVAVNAKKIKKMKKTRRSNLTFEDLEPHFGKNFDSAVANLPGSESTIKRAWEDVKCEIMCNGVSESTAKRGRNDGKCKLMCKDVIRWPNTENKKNDFYSFLSKKGIGSEHFRKNLGSNKQNLLQASTEIVQPEADTVIVKAKYDDDTTRFKLGLPLGMEKLVEEVANRLKLEMGSFKLKYLDEENEEILLTRDSDLLHCPKYPTALGESFIKLFVRLSRK